MLVCFTKILIIIFLFASKFQLTAQNDDEKEIILSGEFKNRMEIRNSYRTLVPDDTSVAVSFQKTGFG